VQPHARVHGDRRPLLVHGPGPPDRPSRWQLARPVSDTARPNAPMRCRPRPARLVSTRRPQRPGASAGPFDSCAGHRCPADQPGPRDSQSNRQPTDPARPAPWPAVENRWASRTSWTNPEKVRALQEANRRVDNRWGQRTYWYKEQYEDHTAVCILRQYHLGHRVW
jgi:hypothetical protein